MKSMKEFYISECARHENKIITSNFSNTMSRRGM